MLRSDWLLDEASLIIIDFDRCKLHFIFIITLHVGPFRLPNVLPTTLYELKSRVFQQPATHNYKIRRYLQEAIPASILTFDRAVGDPDETK